MVSRQAWSINRFGDEWVAQEMDVNQGEMADELLEGLWWSIKLFFWPITLSLWLMKNKRKKKSKLD
jgi:hypothetical protein